MATRRLFDGAVEEIGQIPLVSQSTPVEVAPSIVWVKVSGIWVKASFWTKVSGVWEKTTSYIKDAGIWK